MDWKKYFLPSLIIVTILGAMSWGTIPEAQHKVNDCIRIPAPGDHRDFTNGKKYYYKVLDKSLYTYALELRQTDLQDRTLSASQTNMSIAEVDKKARSIDCIE